MASHNLILLLVLTTAAPDLLVGTSASNVLEQVCDRALDRGFCLNDFGSNPTIKAETGPQLALSAIIKIEVGGTQAEFKIQTLIRSARDPHLKATLQKCDTIYNVVLRQLKSAPDDVSKRQYRHLSYLAKIAFDGGKRCEDLFSIPSRSKSPLSSENRDLRLVGNILGIISDLLSRGIGRGEFGNELGA